MPEGSSVNTTMTGMVPFGGTAPGEVSLKYLSISPLESFVSSSTDILRPAETAFSASGFFLLSYMTPFTNFIPCGPSLRLTTTPSITKTCPNCSLVTNEVLTPSISRVCTAAGLENILITGDNNPLEYKTKPPPKINTTRSTVKRPLRLPASGTGAGRGIFNASSMEGTSVSSPAFSSAMPKPANMVFSAGASSSALAAGFAPPEADGAPIENVTVSSCLPSPGSFFSISNSNPNPPSLPLPKDGSSGGFSSPNVKPPDGASSFFSSTLNPPNPPDGASSFFSSTLNPPKPPDGASSFFSSTPNPPKPSPAPVRPNA